MAGQASPCFLSAQQTQGDTALLIPHCWCWYLQWCQPHSREHKMMLPSCSSGLGNHSSLRRAGRGCKQAGTSAQDKEQLTASCCSPGRDREASLRG